MMRFATKAILTAVLAVVWYGVNLRVSGQTAPGEAPHIGQGGLPQFAEERGWLKLPAKWRLGNTSAVSVDARGARVGAASAAYAAGKPARDGSAPGARIRRCRQFRSGMGQVASANARCRTSGRRTSTAFMSIRKASCGSSAMRCRRTARFSSSRRPESS